MLSIGTALAAEEETSSATAETSSAIAESREETESSLQNWLVAGGAVIAAVVGIVLVAINPGHGSH